MKRLLFATILGISAFATRADFQDHDVIGGASHTINKNDGPVSGVFNLVTSDLDAGPNSVGFVPGSTVASALGTFDFEADGNFVMSFAITLDGIPFASGSTPANGAASVSLDAMDGVGANAANELLILAALGTDGILNYQVTRTDSNAGTLKFNFADLLVKADDVKLPPDSVPTPDAGSTLALAGIGFAAITSLRRKLTH